MTMISQVGLKRGDLFDEAILIEPGRAIVLTGESERRLLPARVRRVTYWAGCQLRLMSDKIGSHGGRDYHFPTPRPFPTVRVNPASRRSFRHKAVEPEHKGGSAAAFVGVSS
jgi:hypothetical protein